jgi:hypothetical protein
MKTIVFSQLLNRERPHSARRVFGRGCAHRRRITLAIGNSTYQHTPMPSSPKNDATDMTAGLEKLNFQAVPLFAWVADVSFEWSSLPSYPGKKLEPGRVCVEV